MSIPSCFVFILLFTCAALSFITKKLTMAGALLGLVIGVLTYLGGGYSGIAMLTSFFVLSSGATAWGLKKKLEYGFAEANKGCRTAGQVFANGGVAAIAGALALYHPLWTRQLELMMAGSLAAATADTLSSELGSLLGKRFYNVMTFKKDERGLDGVVSLEGTLAGTAGALLIGLVYSSFHGWDIALIWVLIAGITGNFIDSLLGAALERRHIIGNNTVNFMNTTAGALVCLALITHYK